MERAMHRLSQVMWRERELLDELHYALEVEQLVLANGRNRWLMKAATAVESVLDDMRKTEMMRAVAADAAADVLGLGPSPSLSQLAEAAPEPWGEILREHRQKMVETTRDITALADTNRELVTSGLRSARETLLALDEETEGYAADGSAVLSASLTGRPTLVDRSF
jgi:hypothetical protein